MQRSSEQPLVGGERYVTTLITAAKETNRIEQIRLAIVYCLHNEIGLCLKIFYVVTFRFTSHSKPRFSSSLITKANMNNQYRNE